MTIHRLGLLCLSCPLCGEEQVQKPLKVRDDLARTELRLAVNAVHERDRHLGDGVVALTRTHEDLHLEHVAETLDGAHDVFDHVALVEAETACEVRHRRVQQHRRDVIRHATCELPTQIPTIHLYGREQGIQGGESTSAVCGRLYTWMLCGTYASAWDVSRARDNVTVRCSLLPTHTHATTMQYVNNDDQGGSNAIASLCQ